MVWFNNYSRYKKIHSQNSHSICFIFEIKNATNAASNPVTVKFRNSNTQIEVPCCDVEITVKLKLRQHTKTSHCEFTLIHFMIHSETQKAE